MTAVFEFVYGLGLFPAILLFAFGPSVLVLISQSFRGRLSNKRVKIEYALAITVSVIVTSFCLLIFSIAGSGI